MVEAEKTAVIGAYAFPEFLWVAVGGKSKLGDKVEFLDGQRHSATGWSCYTSPGQTGGDELATCLYHAAEKYFAGRKIRTDYSDGDPDKEAGFYILNRTKCPAAFGKGWWSLVEPVAATIDSYNAAHPDMPIEVSQIKQKNGGLRIYHHNAPEEIRRLIDDAVATAWRTCEKCGSQEGVTTNQTGYRRTLCPACHAGVRPRIDRLHNIKIQRNNRNTTTL